MTSDEFTRWIEYYRIEDAAKAGRFDPDDGEDVDD